MSLPRCRPTARRGVPGFTALVLLGLSGAAGWPEGSLRAQEGDAPGARRVPPAIGAPRGASVEGLALTWENVFRSGGGVRDAALSPDGRWVALVAEGEAGAGIHLLRLQDDSAERGGREAAEGAAGRTIGTGPLRPAGDPVFRVAGREPSWSPDGARIVFVRDGVLWSVRRGGGEPRRLTGELSGVRAPVFSPDGRRVAFYATETGSQDVWLVEASGGGEARPLTRGAMAADDDRFAPAWSPDGGRIAYVSNAAGFWRDDVWLVEVATGRTRQLSAGLMASSTPVWSPSGDRIAIFGTSRSGYWYQDLAELYLLDPATGSERVLEMQVWASDFAMRNRPMWSEDGRTLYFPYMERGDYALWAVPAAGGVATRVTQTGGAMGSFDLAAGRAVFVREAPEHGRELYGLPTEGGSAERLTRLTPRWSEVVEPEEVSYRSFDGLYIQGFLYRPPGLVEGERCPAVVQVHGGGTNSYLRGQNLVEQTLAAHGFVVLAINYRGGSGFGRAFQDLAVEDWLNDQARDPGAAAAWLRALPFTTDRVGIYGGSYGGMMTMSAITRTPDVFDAAVAMRGTYSETLTFDEQDRLGKIFSRTGHGGLPGERPEIYRKTETLERFGAIRTPVLLMHGEEDVRAPFSNYELAVAALDSLEKEYEAVSYPGEGHGFRDPANLVDMNTRLETFLRRHLGACRGAVESRVGD